MRVILCIEALDEADGYNLYRSNSIIIIIGAILPWHLLLRCGSYEFDIWHIYVGIYNIFCMMIVACKCFLVIVTWKLVELGCNN